MNSTKKRNPVQEVKQRLAAAAAAIAQALFPKTSPALVPVPIRSEQHLPER